MGKNRNKIVDFQKEIDEEEDNIESYGNNVITHIDRDAKIFLLDLVTYCITK
jgi:hypothetical protein